MESKDELTDNEIKAIADFYSAKKRRLKFASVHELLKHLDE
ncbi:MAG: hypothetical protein ACREA7_04370 [Nitrosotalea sp.]